MKKLFLSLMLVAAVAAGFTSCKKDNNESTTHAQTFTLGEQTFHVDNAITIENAKDNDGNILNAIVLSQGKMVGNSADGRGIVIVFKDNITAGTYSLSTNTESFPKYLFADLEVEDIVDFDMEELMEQDDVFAATGGSFTLEINGNSFVITTSNINVEQVVEPYETATSSVDFEGSMSRYKLSTVQPGSVINDGETDTDIVTAGTFTYTLPLLGSTKIAAFITAEGNMLGFTYDGEALPTEAITTNALYLNGMDISGIEVVQNIEVNISLGENDVYTVDIAEVTLSDTTYTLHYVGTMPYFDFPF